MTGVFDLQAGVHLHEEELVGPVGGHDEFDGARAGVVHAARGVARGRADARPGRRVEQRRRALPRSPSGGAAAGCTRARRGDTTLP